MDKLEEIKKIRSLKDLVVYLNKEKLKAEVSLDNDCVEVYLPEEKKGTTLYIIPETEVCDLLEMLFNDNVKVDHV